MWAKFTKKRVNNFREVKGKSLTYENEPDLLLDHECRKTMFTVICRKYQKSRSKNYKKIDNHFNF